MAIFKVPMVAVTATAVQDLWSLKAAATRGFIVHEIVLNQKGLTAVEAWNLKWIRQTVTVTQGSGGTTPTPIPMAPGGAASGVTVHMNDTTQSSAGTLTNVHADVMQILNGLFYLPAPEDRIIIDAATAFILSLATAPSASCSLSGTITYEEFGV